MKQLTLPSQPERESTSAEIRALVLQRLHGFRFRQRARQDARDRRKGRRLPAYDGGRGPRRTAFQAEVPIVKSPIVFRAQFRGPKGPLNPSGWTVPGLISVEIFHARAKPSEWQARNPDTGVLFKITGQILPSSLMEQIELHYFEKQESFWQAHDSQTWPVSGRFRPLSDNDYYIDSSGNPILKDEYRHTRQAERTERNSVTG